MPTEPENIVKQSEDNVPMRYATLTVIAAVLTMGIKFYAAWVTGSVGLLSDAMESIVNLVTSIILVILLRIAKAPPDPDHPHGHDKAEYFANGVQGTLIILAAIGIVMAAVERLRSPQGLEAGYLGLGLSVVAGFINVALARLLKNVGERSRSNALIGEAAHLMSDVWTSVAVIVGVGLVYLTGQPVLDPVVAIVMSLFILATGWQLLNRFIAGLMDTSLPPEPQKELEEFLDGYRVKKNFEYHALRSRVSGARTFVSMHVLVPGSWTVSAGHELCDEIEAAVAEQIPGASVLTHLEPIEEEVSFQDIEL